MPIISYEFSTLFKRIGSVPLKETFTKKEMVKRSDKLFNSLGFYVVGETNVDKSHKQPPSSTAAVTREKEAIIKALKYLENGEHEYQNRSRARI